MSKLLFALLLTFALFSCGNTEEDLADSEVPAAVMSAFQTAYPGATDVEWEVEGDKYEVEFEMNGEDMEVEMDLKGNIREIND